MGSAWSSPFRIIATGNGDPTDAPVECNLVRISIGKRLEFTGKLVVLVVVADRLVAHGYLIDNDDKDDGPSITPNFDVKITLSAFIQLKHQIIWIKTVT